MWCLRSGIQECTAFRDVYHSSSRGVGNSGHVPRIRVSNILRDDRNRVDIGRSSPYYVAELHDNHCSVQERMNIHPKLMVTKPLEGNRYTWTLASQLGKMLRLAEQRFGPRDRSYTPVGIEFVDGVPQNWFPGNCGHIVIQLGLPCMNEPDRACFQLAHETIHLLSPTGGRNANVLEEGLAAHFQSWYMKNHYPPDWPRSDIDWDNLACESYARARALVHELLAHGDDVVKKLRTVEPALSRITANLIQQFAPAVSRETAEALEAKFAR